MSWSSSSLSLSGIVAPYFDHKYKGPPFELFGPWPWYLVAAEFLAVALLSLLYLPFALADLRARVKPVIDSYRAPQ